MHSSSEPYHHARFTWWQQHKRIDLIERLERDFHLTLPVRPEDTSDLSPYKGFRWEILVKADTLSAYLSPSRAVLFQKQRAPFTRKDLELREIVFSLYPHSRPTPF